MSCLRSARFVVVLASLPLLVSGTCHFYYSSHHGCDGWHAHTDYSHCHVHASYAGHTGVYPADHDHAYASLYEHPWILRQYSVDSGASADGIELARIHSFPGIDLGVAFTGDGEEVAALRERTREVREVNDDLIGCRAGRLVFAGIEHGDDTLRVVWRQVFDGRHEARREGQQVFVLDEDCVLREIHNRLWRD